MYDPMGDLGHGKFSAQQEISLEEGSQDYIETF